MTSSFRAIGAYLALPVFACVLIAAPLAVRAADTPAQTASDESNHKHAHDIIQGPHVEGHIAFLHAELRITPAQEQLWSAVAAAMREDVQTIQDAEDKTADQMGPTTAIQYLQGRVMFANLRAKGEARFLEAFRPLYDSLSNDQKKMANELLIPSAPEQQ